MPVFIIDDFETGISTDKTVPYADLPVEVLASFVNSGDEDAIKEVDRRIANSDRFYALVDEMRQAREPAGSGKGGQFASKNSGATVAAEMTATPATVGGLDRQTGGKLTKTGMGRIEDSLRESYETSRTTADTMDPLEEQSLEHYRTMGFISINGHLRDPNKPFDESFEDQATNDKHIKAMDAIIDRSPSLPSDLVVYRGVDGDAAKRLGLKGDKAVGKVIIDDGFISTSLSSSEATDFAGSNIVLEITVPKGGKALSMNLAENNTGISFQHEREFLLPRSSPMVVTGSYQAFRNNTEITILEVSVTP